MGITEHFVELHHRSEVCSTQTREEINFDHGLFINSPTRIATAGCEDYYYQALREFDKDYIATRPSRTESMLKILLLLLNFLVIGLVLFWVAG